MLSTVEKKHTDIDKKEMEQVSKLIKGGDRTSFCKFSPRHLLFVDVAIGERDPNSNKDQLVFFSEKSGILGKRKWYCTRYSKNSPKDSQGVEVEKVVEIASNKIKRKLNHYESIRNRKGGNPFDRIGQKQKFRFFQNVEDYVNKNKPEFLQSAEEQSFDSEIKLISKNAYMMFPTRFSIGRQGMDVGVNHILFFKNQDEGEKWYCRYKNSHGEQQDDEVTNNEIISLLGKRDELYQKNRDVRLENFREVNYAKLVDKAIALEGNNPEAYKKFFKNEDVDNIDEALEGFYGFIKSKGENTLSPLEKDFLNDYEGYKKRYDYIKNNYTRPLDKLHPHERKTLSSFVELKEEQGVLSDSRRVLIKTGRVLGEGGFGRVDLWKDRDANLYAVKQQKLKHGSYISEVYNEVRLGEQMGDSVNYSVDLFKENGEEYMFMVSEYGGEDLFNYFENRGGELKKEEFEDISLAVLEQLDEMHGRGIIHRDIKPENIVVAKDGNVSNVRIIDYGMSRKVSKESLVFRSRMIGGTRYYLAPEIDGKVAEYTDKSDVYAMGKSLHYMFFIQACVEEEAGITDINNEGGKLWNTNEALRRIVHGMMNQNSDERPTAREARLQLFFALHRDEAKQREYVEKLYGDDQETVEAIIALGEHNPERITKKNIDSYIKIKESLGKNVLDDIMEQLPEFKDIASIAAVAENKAAADMIKLSLDLLKKDYSGLDQGVETDKLKAHIDELNKQEGAFDQLTKDVFRQTVWVANREYLNASEKEEGFRQIRENYISSIEKVIEPNQLKKEKSDAPQQLKVEQELGQGKESKIYTIFSNLLKALMNKIRSPKELNSKDAKQDKIMADRMNENNAKESQSASSSSVTGPAAMFGNKASTTLELGQDNADELDVKSPSSGR